MQADRNEVIRIESELSARAAQAVSERIKERKRQRLERIGICLFFAFPVLYHLLK